jgi:hypothetical protein
MSFRLDAEKHITIVYGGQEIMQHRFWSLVGILSIYIVGAVIVSADEADKKQEEKATAMLTVQFDTTPPGGKYKPKNVGAVWATDSDGAYAHTLYVWGKKQKKQLKDWKWASRGKKVDAVTAATRRNHNTPIRFQHPVNGSQEALSKMWLNLMVTDSNGAKKKHKTRVSLSGLADSTSQTIEAKSGFKNIIITLKKKD